MVSHRYYCVLVNVLIVYVGTGFDGNIAFDFVQIVWSYKVG